jgi:hypothetical protein
MACSTLPNGEARIQYSAHSATKTHDRREPVEMVGIAQHVGAEQPRPRYVLQPVLAAGQIAPAKVMKKMICANASVIIEK